MVGLNWTLIVIMTVACFVLGAVWHGPLFGKLWMRIHHGKDSFNAKEMAEATKGMWKLMVTESVATGLMVISIACLVRAIPSMPGWQIALMVWVGFVLPTMTSTVIWGADTKKYMATKIAVSSICRLIGLLATGYVLSNM
jgi:Protein of unknown function (DUF1761)